MRTDPDTWPIVGSFEADGSDKKVYKIIVRQELPQHIPVIGGSVIAHSTTKAYYTVKGHHLNPVDRYDDSEFVILETGVTVKKRT